jgi:hypothetical protein
VDRKFFEIGPRFLAVVFTFNSTLPLPYGQLVCTYTWRRKTKREVRKVLSGKEGVGVEKRNGKKAGASSNLFSCLFAPYSIIV